MYSIGKYSHDGRIRASTTLFPQAKDVNLNVKEIFFKYEKPLGEQMEYSEFLKSAIRGNFDKHFVLGNFRLQNWSENGLVDLRNIF
ncbi:MAG: hypothetical protein V4577_04400 [Bacteroidota bacterium]